MDLDEENISNQSLLSPLKVCCFNSLSGLQTTSLQKPSILKIMSQGNYQNSNQSILSFLSSLNVDYTTYESDEEDEDDDEDDVEQVKTTPPPIVQVKCDCITLEPSTRTIGTQTDVINPEYNESEWVFVKDNN